jgi:hypothetical protein
MAKVKNRRIKTALKNIKKNRAKLTQEEKVVEAENLPYKFFNLKRIIFATGIDQYKVYNNFKGNYNSLSPEECKRIATALMTPMSKVFAKLGMSVSFKQLETPSNAGQ